MTRPPPSPRRRVGAPDARLVDERHRGGGPRHDVAGDLGLGRTDTLDKGKARMTPTTDDDEEADHQGDEVDRAWAEERRIRENLAAWSKADRYRRASRRRTSEFVTPTTTPGPTLERLLFRKTTTTTVTRIRRNHADPTNGETRSRAPATTTTTDGGTSSTTTPLTQRGATRRSESSVGLHPHHHARDGGAVVVPSPDAAAEDDEDRSVELELAPVRLSSGSRFIEDLPFASSSSRPPTPPNEDENPFSDPHGHDRSTSVTLERDEHERPESIASTCSATEPDPFGRGHREVEPASTAAVAADDRDDQRRARRAPQPGSSLRHDTPPLPHEGMRQGDDNDDEVEENAPVRGTVGLVDWLLCGCWRPRGWDLGDDEIQSNRGWDRDQQHGRTNPME
ncbi:hypothetical protein JCM11491_000264 [Sporobolomyces phaffii]